MRIEQLSYLLVIKNCHSITQTGEILHISQQAISIAIKQLEDELGTLLLQRTSKGSYLTSAGEKVVDFATEFFDKWDVLTHEIMLENNTEEKTLFLYLQPDMQLDTFIPKIISILENNIPHLKLNIQYAHIENIVSFCQNEANAIGIYTISEEQYKNIPKCHQMILNTLYLTIWANHKSNILKSGTCSLASLKSQNIFSFFSESASENPIVDIIKKYNLKQNNQVLYNIPNYVCKQFVNDNYGIFLSFMSEENIYKNRSGIGFRIIPKENIKAYQVAITQSPFLYTILKSVLTR